MDVGFYEGQRLTDLGKFSGGVHSAWVTRRVKNGVTRRRDTAKIDGIPIVVRPNDRRRRRSSVLTLIARGGCA